MAILEVKDLEVCYGVIQAIKGISFEVNQGEIIALIGANGAGKTTTLQTITGLIPSKAGTITSGEDRFMAWKTTDGSYENTQAAQFDTFF